MTATPHLTNALALHQKGQFAEAEVLYRAVIAAAPDDAEALQLLGVLCHQRGDNEEAVVLIDRAIALLPDNAAWHANRGLALRGLGRLTDAAEALARAIELRPDYAEGHSNLGLVQHQLQQFSAATASFRRAIALKPAVPGFHLNLGKTLLEISDVDGAVGSFRHVLTLSPDHPAAHYNLGHALIEADQLDAAERHFRRSMALQPGLAAAPRGLGVVLRRLGRTDEALALYEAALALDPSNIEGRQQLLLVENYLALGTPADAAASARRFQALMPAPASPLRPHTNNRDPNRQLRIGFVSGDFRTHPVGRFVGHLLEHFDRTGHFVALYPNQKRGDATTDGFRSKADLWRSIVRDSDEVAETMIRSDDIDILIDLSGHTGDNRLSLFARKPAPVQATWLGYSGTTGLEAIDYIIADTNVIPPADDHYFVETPIRLPDAYLCYGPPDADLPVSQTPAIENGYVTFGTFNRLDKMSDAAVATWARILEAVPGSKLLLRARDFDAAESRAATERRYAAHGIAPEKLILRGWVAGHLQHLRDHALIDVGLDPFPYNGTTTTSDALWMGVPVVTLAGDRFTSRVGASLMRTLGHPELVASTRAEYVAKAVSLASDIGRLEALRGSIRPQFVASPLCDAPRFVRNFEAALRGMWRTYCETGHTSTVAEN